MGFRHWAGRSSASSPAESDTIMVLPTPTVIIEEAHAQTTLLDLPPDNLLRVGNSYRLQVDIHQDLQRTTLPIRLQNSKEETINIVVNASDMTINPDWMYNMVITSSGKSPSPEFVLTPKSTGKKIIVVQYYFQSHLLTQVKHQVEVI